MTAALRDPWRPTPLEVQQVILETADTVTLTLDASASPLGFAPGQFNMVYAFGQGEVPLSISGDPREPYKVVHTVRAVGGVTRTLLDLKPGAMLGVRGPYGSTWPLDDIHGADVIVLAGGIGLAPLRPVIYHLLANRALYARVRILYGSRSPDDLLYLRQLHHWRGRFDCRADVIVDRAGPDWFGPVGVVTRLLGRAIRDPDETVVLTCGPEIMMQFVVRDAMARGVASERIWVSMERNMKCAIAQCGHCLWGSSIICRDGPVFRWDHIADRFRHRQL